MAEGSCETLVLYFSFLFHPRYLFPNVCRAYQHFAYSC